MNAYFVVVAGGVLALLYGIWTTRQVLAANAGTARMQEIAGAFAELPVAYRAICALYFLDEFSYLEMADIIGCSLETLRSRLHRGRKMLPYTLQSYAQRREPEGRSALSPTFA